MLRVLTFIFLAFGSAATAAAERYSNAKYGISFDLPARAEVCRSPAPLPNHGLLFRPAGVTSPPCDDDIQDGARYTSADAHFDVDASTTIGKFVSTACPQMAYDSGGKVTNLTLPVRLAGPASVACRIDGANGSIFEIVFAQRGATEGVPTTNYTLVLKTTRQDYTADHAAFLRWLATVRIGRPL